MSVLVVRMTLRGEILGREVSKPEDGSEFEDVPAVDSQRSGYLGFPEKLQVEKRERCFRGREHVVECSYSQELGAERRPYLLPERQQDRSNHTRLRGEGQGSAVPQCGQLLVIVDQRVLERFIVSVVAYREAQPDHQEEVHIP